MRLLNFYVSICPPYFYLHAVIVIGGELAGDSEYYQTIAKDIEKNIKKLVHQIVTVLETCKDNCSSTHPSHYQFENGSVLACLQCLSLMLDFHYKGDYKYMYNNYVCAGVTLYVIAYKIR